MASINFSGGGGDGTDGVDVQRGPFGTRPVDRTNDPNAGIGSTAVPSNPYTTITPPSFRTTEAAATLPSIHNMPLPPGAYNPDGSTNGTWVNDPVTGAAVWKSGPSGTVQDYWKSDWYKNVFNAGREASGQSGANTPPPAGGNPMDPAYIAQWVAYHANQPGANPSTKNDPQYWVNKILETGGWQGDNAGYWGGPRGMYRVEGAPEGGAGGGTAAPSGNMNYQQAVAYLQSKSGKTLSAADQAALLQKFGGNQGSTFTAAGLDPVVAYLRSAGGTGGTGGGSTRSPFAPLGPDASGGYNDALNIIRQRYKEYYGHDISDAELNAIKQKYGFTPDVAGTGPTSGTRQTSTRLDPNMSGSADQAVAYLQGQAQRVLNRPLSDAEIQQGAALVGYKQGQPVTGAMVNRILDELDKLAPMTGGSAGTPGSTHTYTSSDLNPILQDLYNHVTTGGAAGPGGPGPGNGNPGGYTDQSSKLYMEQVLQRLMELRKPINDPMQNLMMLSGLTRMQDLQGAPYTAGEDAAMVTHYRDPLTLARDQAKQQAIEEMSRRGIGPTSGLFERRLGNVDKGYEQGIAQGSNDLAVRAVAEKQRRQDESLSILNNLVNVNRTGADRQNAAYDQALSVAKMMPDFDQQRLNQLLAASGEGPNSSGIMANLTALAKLGFDVNNQNNTNSGNNSAVWGQLIGALLAGLGHG